MSETLSQREDTMRKVLRMIQEKTSFEKLTFEEQRIAKECYDLKLFEGVQLIEMISGRIVAEYQFDARITHKGLQFLEPEPTKVEVSMSPEERELAENDRRQQRDAAAEQQRQKELRETIRLQERREDQANEKRYNANQNRTTLLAALISGTSGLLLGMAVEHFGKVIDIILSLCQ